MIHHPFHPPFPTAGTIPGAIPGPDTMAPASGGFPVGHVGNMAGGVPVTPGPFQAPGSPAPFIRQVQPDGTVVILSVLPDGQPGPPIKVDSVAKPPVQPPQD